MIIIKGRKLTIPKVDSFVGFQGDNLVETRTFESTRLYNNIDLSILDFKLDIQSGTSKNIIDLSKEILADKIILTWTVLEAHLVNSGLAQIQLRGFNGTLEKWHSDIEYITIKQSINASEAFPDPLPSEFEEMEIRITAAKNTAVEANENATLKAREAFESAEDAAESAAKAKRSEIDVGQAKDEALFAIGAVKDNTLLAVGNKGNEQVSRVNTAGDTQVARVEAVLEDIVVVGKTTPDFGIWLEEV